MTTVDNAIGYIRQHQDKALEDLKALCAIPSISTLSQHKPDMQIAAEWAANKLREVGLHNVAIMPTSGHPVVFAESTGSTAKPTILIYGHYDVQPIDPIDEWDSPPFEPTLKRDHCRDGAFPNILYARGVSDMKSQIVSMLAALDAVHQSKYTLPATIKIILEGEEEIGSPNLAKYIEQHKDLLQCDFSLNMDSGILHPDIPAIVYGLRGLAYFDLCVRGPESDLHSGHYGGAVHNPAQVLCELIASMHDHDGRVTLRGFYDKVKPLDEEERINLASTAPNEQAFLAAAANPPALHGEFGYSTQERVSIRPTLEVNGIHSGFTGHGSKTVLPAKAIAKISMRLVPDQDPADIAQQLHTHLTEHAPASISWDLAQLAHVPAAIVGKDSLGVRAAANALTEVFGVKPVFKRTGGTVPVVGLLHDILGVDSVMLGFSLPDNCSHGPNEKQHIPTFYRGIEAYLHFLVNISQ